MAETLGHIDKKQYADNQFRMHFDHLNTEDQMSAFEVVRSAYAFGGTMRDIGKILEDRMLIVPSDWQGIIEEAHIEQLGAITNYYFENREFINEVLDNRE